MSGSINTHTKEVVNGYKPILEKSERQLNKNLFVNFGFSLLVMAVSTMLVLFVWNYHSGTEIAEMKAEQALKDRETEIYEQAIADYKNSFNFQVDAADFVANNFDLLSVLITLHEEMPIKDKKKFDGLFYYLSESKNQCKNKYPELYEDIKKRLREN